MRFWFAAVLFVRTWTQIHKMLYNFNFIIKENTDLHMAK